MTSVKFGSQGTFDLFCGFYAIANAFYHLQCRGKDGLLEAVDFFDICCDETNIPIHELNRDGIKFREVCYLVNKCIEISSSSKITAKKVKTNRRKFDTFAHDIEVFFDSKSNLKCAILRLTHPHDHWVVLIKDAKLGWMTIDSLRRKRTKTCIDLSTFVIGDQFNATQSLIKIKPSELILIEKTA